MDQRKQPKIIVLSAMNGRHGTVYYCQTMLPEVDIYMGYSTDEDGNFLKRIGIQNKFQFPNQPLSSKWNNCIQQLRNVDFDAVVLLGSDDYFDQAFLTFVRERVGTFDLMAFTDIYFEHGVNYYYWSGYDGPRKGEPAGAGKVYSKEFLERIDYNLFPVSRNNSLDAMSWRVCQDNNCKVTIHSLHENGLFLCDVKDGMGLTPLKLIRNIEFLK